jgi:hypothetical protein
MGFCGCICYTMFLALCIFMLLVLTLYFRKKIKAMNFDFTGVFGGGNIIHDEI